MRCVRGLVLATKDLGNFRRESSQGKVRSIDDVPRALDIARLWRERSLQLWLHEVSAPKGWRRETAPALGTRTYGIGPPYVMAKRRVGNSTVNLAAGGTT